jgi:hypothetical protein
MIAKLVKVGRIHQNIYCLFLCVGVDLGLTLRGEQGAEETVCTEEGGGGRRWMTDGV